MASGSARAQFARLATPLAAVGVAILLLHPVPALAQLSTPAAALGVPAQPAVPGVDVGNVEAAAREIAERVSSTASGTIVTERPGRVMLDSETDGQAPPGRRGFMQPSFAPVPTVPLVVQGAQPSFGAGYATPGFFTMRRQEGPPAVENLFTSPAGDPPRSTAP